MINIILYFQYKYKLFLKNSKINHLLVKLPQSFSRMDRFRSVDWIPKSKAGLIGSRPAKG